MQRTYLQLTHFWTTLTQIFVMRLEITNICVQVKVKVFIKNVLILDFAIICSEINKLMLMLCLVLMML